MIELLQNVWDISEPIIGFSGVIFVIWYWINTMIAKSKKYRNTGSKKYVIAVQIGRPVSEAVKIHFGEIDTLIDVYSVIGKSTLENKNDYKKIVKEVYSALAQNQNSKIHLIVSGPVGLNVLIGQVIGFNHFDVNIYQYDAIAKSYFKLPSPSRNWLKH